jgi:hypothetical protein
MFHGVLSWLYFETSAPPWERLRSPVRLQAIHIKLQMVYPG